MSNTIPLVSIICPTYNHERYIAQALDGFIMQKTTFPFEIIVHDDASTDDTANIIKRYERESPHLFANIYQKDNQFSKAISNPTKITFAAARGKYIALCEGDDYWTDPLKLQKQVEYLETNPGFAICFHNSSILYEDEPGKIAYSNPRDQVEVSSFEDLAKGEYIYTATCVFRSENFKKMPIDYHIYINNYTLDLQNAQYGKIKYINEVMSVYRVHKGGMWSMVAREKTLISQLPTYKFYISYFDKKYKLHFKNHLKDMTAEIVSIKLKNNDVNGFWKYYKDYVRYNAADGKQLKTILYLFLKASRMQVKKLFNK